jgi:hypothetical protein
MPLPVLLLREAGSLLLLVSGWVAPTLLGMGFVVGRALVVAGVAELAYFGVRGLR